MDELQLLLANTAEASARAAELRTLLSLPETLADSRYSAHLMREYARLRPWAEAHDELMEAMDALAANRREQRTAEPEMLPLYREEEVALERRVQEAADKARALMQSLTDGGEEACRMTVRDETAGNLSADILRIYARYLDGAGVEYTLEPSADGGTLTVGHGGYGLLRYEGGMHKRTDGASATVTVMPIRPHGVVTVSPEEIRVDIFCSTGKGGQNINKVETAVRITHLPTGIVVTCQDERSQLMNKKRALATLTERLQQRQDAEDATSTQRMRDEQIQDRSNAVRRYDVPHNELRDMRTHVAVPLKDALRGEIDPLIRAIALAKRT